MVALICWTQKPVYRGVEFCLAARTQDTARGGHGSGNQPQALRGFGRRWLDGAAVFICGAWDLAACEALEETDREGADGNRPAAEEAAMRGASHGGESSKERNHTGFVNNHLGAQ